MIYLGNQAVGVRSEMLGGNVQLKTVIAGQNYTKANKVAELFVEEFGSNCKFAVIDKTAMDSGRTTQYDFYMATATVQNGTLSGNYCRWNNGLTFNTATWTENYLLNIYEGDTLLALVWEGGE